MFLRRSAVAAAIVAAAVALAAGAPHPRRLSFHNRLLLNRAAVLNLRTIEVMLLAADGGISAVRARVDRVGGGVKRADDAIGYMRVEIPLDQVLAVTEPADVEAWQIASLSKATWYRDATPRVSAEMYRRYETTVPALPPSQTSSSLPLLSATAAHTPAYTADDETGVGEWLKRHPTYDGRGVTIALLETGQASFLDPIFGVAKTLDGRDVAKLAGIVSTIDPDEPDESRVSLSTAVHATSTWARVGARTYIVPKAGDYHFGVFEIPASSAATQRFGVLERDDTGEILVDTNGDASFRDESPIRDVSDTVDARVLKVAYPQARDLAFVMARGSRPHTVQLYLASGSHQTMTASVAAGSRTSDGLAYGVAPGARILLVHAQTLAASLAQMLETYVEVVKRPDVDVLSDSFGMMLVPDVAVDFGGRFFERLEARYGKPIIHAAGNGRLVLGNTAALDGGFSVGGSLGAASFSAFYGGATIDELIVHPVSSVGPALDGAIKPDFLAPEYRVAADRPGAVDTPGLPKNAPTTRLPPGYQISCCTSASSPYAAGLVALLISAARQEHIAWSYDALARALRLGARFLPAFQSFEQGNGVLDVEGAWRELTHPVAVPRITSSAAIVHPLAQYATNGPRGEGIFEVENWSAGATGHRDIRFRRETGPSQPVTYRIDWTGNDGTFSATSSIGLPLHADVPVTIQIAPKTAGVHSALLNLREAGTNAIVRRVQAAIVATEPIDPSTKAVRVKGTIGVMRSVAHYVAVPPGVDAMSIELHVVRGTIKPIVVPNNWLAPSYYEHVIGGGEFPVGRYHLAVQSPTEGIWSIALVNDSAQLGRQRELISTTAADYEVEVRLLDAPMRIEAAGGTIAVSVENRGSTIAEPALNLSTGMLTSHEERLLTSGLPNQIPIEVPPDASTMRVELRAASGSEGVELHLYECTTGECFADALPLPAARGRTVVVRKPAAGRWIAAVNAAPFAGTSGAFVLDAIITTGEPRRIDRTSPLANGESWTEHIDVQRRPAGTDRAVPIVLAELIDRALDRDEAEHGWRGTPDLPLRRDRPAAIGAAVCRLNRN